jgi:hypothetical protein
MKTKFLVLFALAAVAAFASPVILTYAPTPTNLGDLNHQDLYTWRVDGVNLGGQTITGATLTITHIANWNTSANELFIYLLDTAVNAGVASYLEDPSGVGPITDSFGNHTTGGLVAAGTAQTLLTEPSFTTTPTDYTYAFTAGQLSALQTYIGNGNNFALGFDPDCHYFNNGISLKITTAPASVPEPSSVVLLGSGLLASLTLLRRRMRKQS